MDRPAGGRLPHDRRFALVRDTDRHEIACAQPARGKGRASHIDRRSVDLVRIVLHVAGRGVVLRDLAVRASEDTAGVVEHECRRSGGSLIEGQDRRPGHAVTPW